MIENLDFKETLITASCRLNFTIVNDKQLFECCPVSSDVLCIKCRDKINIFKDFKLKKKKKSTKSNPKQQWNTLNKSLFFKLSIPGTNRGPIVKLFKNGVVQVNGIKNVEELSVCGLWTKRFEWFICYLYSCIKINPSTVSMTDSSIKLVEPFTVKMVNFRTTISHPLNLIAVKANIKKYVFQHTVSECQLGTIAVITYGIDNRAVLIVRIITPNVHNMKKITCVSLTAFGKINIQGSVNRDYLPAISNFINLIIS